MTPLLIARGLGRFDRVDTFLRELPTERLLPAPSKTKDALKRHKSVHRLVRECDELAERESELDRIAAMGRPARSPLDAVWCARLCFWKKRYEAATRWFQEAFRLDPTLADDIDAQHRYLAAWAAAKAERWELAERWVAEERRVWEKRPPHRGYRVLDDYPRRWMIERVLAEREE